MVRGKRGQGSRTRRKQIVVEVGIRGWKESGRWESAGSVGEADEEGMNDLLVIEERLSPFALPGTAISILLPVRLGDLPARQVSSLHTRTCSDRCASLPPRLHCTG